MGQISATFTGIASIKSVVFPRSLGVTPNTIILTCVPQSSSISPVGTLRVSDGFNWVQMSDIKVDWVTSRLTPQGVVMIVVCLDRRWRWKYSPINIRCNIPLADGTVDPNSQLSPQQIATLLFTAMNEVTFDVSALPDDGYPYIDLSYDRADLELHKLCQSRGCDVTIGVDGVARIVRLGEGLPLVMDASAISPQISADLPEGPDFLFGVCDETRFQSRLKLEPVGVDTDGSIKSVDDLTYKPTDGWDSVSDENYFEQVGEDGMDESQVAKARATVGKMYRVVSQADGSQDVPGFGSVDSISQILPINDYLNHSYDAAGGTIKENNDARVLGIFLEKGDPPTDKNPDNWIQYDGPFRIDRKTGVVVFPRGMFKYDDDNKLVFADLYLETSYCVRSKDTNQTLRYTYEYPVTGYSPGLVEPVKLYENCVTFTAIYNDSSPTVVDSVEDNVSDVSMEMADILAVKAMSYRLVGSGSILYGGVKLVEPDGNLRQVVYSLSDVTGATTLISCNSEAAVGPPRARMRHHGLMAEYSAVYERNNFGMNRMRSSGVMR